MSELNFELLQENIRALLKKHDLTQNALAEITGMTQANVSKALNRNESSLSITGGGTKRKNAESIYTTPSWLK